MAKKNTAQQLPEASVAHFVTHNDVQWSSDVVGDLAPSSFAVYIRVLRQNWRQGTVACKGRADVSYSTRKPWKQKGTGRARAGSLRSPIWRKGGVTFGPQPRTQTLKVSQSLKKNVLKALFLNKLKQQRVIALDHAFGDDVIKTSAAFNLLKQAGLHTAKIILLVATHDYQMQLSFANLPNVKMYLFDQPNAYTLSHGDYWVYLKKDSDSFKQMVDAWL